MIEVALAVLPKDGCFLMQLRDNIPGIVYPGYWGLFGGHLEPEETPEVSLKRELVEEIGYSPESVFEFNSYQEGEVIRHVFYAPLTVTLEQLELKEGWDFGLVTLAEIEAGCRYSAKAGMVREIGSPHRKILLDFVKEFGCRE